MLLFAYNLTNTRVAAFNDVYRRYNAATSSIAPAAGTSVNSTVQLQSRDGYEFYEGGGDVTAYAEPEHPAHDVSKYSKSCPLI